MSDVSDVDPATNGFRVESPAPETNQNGLHHNQRKLHSPSPGHLRENSNSISRNIGPMTPRRVKVYLLEGEDWLDNGTGYCEGVIDTTAQRPYFIVRNELDSKDIILKSFLEGSIQYQRQQETLIVWTDLEGKDLALSFQENDGCADLCEFIIRVQQEGLSPMISLYYVLSTLYDSQGDGPREITELITGPISYPPDDLSLDSLDELLDIINQGANSQYTRACILKFIVESSYIHKLYILQQEAEKAQDIASLHTLSDITKCILLYNDHALIEELVSSESSILDLVGLLEYDRDLPTFKACHREYLLDESKFRSIIDVPTPADQAGSDMSIFRKDFVLSYLKNVVLARWMDDSTLNTISSLIYENQMDIITYLSKPDDNDDFLGRLLRLYDEDLTNTENLQKCRDAVKMLHQYVSVTKGQPSTQKSEFFTALIKAGLIKLIKFSLEGLDSFIRSIGTEMLVTVIEQDVSLVHCTHYDDNSQVDELDPPVNAAHTEACENEEAVPGPNLRLKLYNDTSFTLVLCNLFLKDKNLGLKLQAYEALRTLLTFTVTNENNSQEDAFMKPLFVKSSRPDLEIIEINQKFFKSFYQRVASVLFQDFIYIASESSELSVNAEARLVLEPILFQHLCELIAFCFQEHELSLCRDFFIQNNILVGVMRILSLETKITLKLAAVRCFKTLIFLNDNSLTRYIIEKDLLSVFVDFFATTARGNNLANSLCIDLLEILLRRGHEKNFKALALTLYNNHKSFIETITYVSTGNEFIQMVESTLDHNADPTATSIDDNYKDNFNSPIESEREKGQESHEQGLSPLGPVKYLPHKRHIVTEEANEKDNGNISCNGNSGSKKPKVADYLSAIKKDGDLKT